MQQHADKEMILNTLNHTEAHAIMDIAEMLRRDGNRQYGVPGAAECAYQASLCGVTALYNRSGDIMTLKTHDLSVSVRLQAMPADESDGIARNSETITDVQTLYHKGDTMTLAAWHRHLCAYRRSMRSHHSAAA